MYHPKHGMIAFSIIQNGRLGRKQPNILVMRQAQEYGLAKILKKHIGLLLWKKVYDDLASLLDNKRVLQDSEEINLGNRLDPRLS